MKHTRCGSIVMAMLIASCADGVGPDGGARPAWSIAELASPDAIRAFETTVLGSRMPGAEACVYVQSLRRFECPTATVGDFTVDRWFQLLDSAGNARAEWSAAVVAIRQVHDMRGTLTLPSGSSTIREEMVGHEDATLTGLGTETQTLVAAGRWSATLLSTPDSPTRTTARLTHLAFPREKVPDMWATGSIASITTRADGAHLSTVLIEYDASPVIRTTTSIHGGPVVICTIDQRQPELPPACHQGPL